VLEEFTIDRMISKTEALYFRLLEKRLALNCLTASGPPAKP